LVVRLKYCFCLIAFVTAVLCSARAGGLTAAALAREASPASPLLISELRLRGPGGAKDEFVEVYNNTDVDITVGAPDGSAGYAVAASDGVVRFVIPNGTVIPARGHFLGVNSDGYTLAGYPAGNASTARGDASYTNDIADNAGLALFRTASPANFNLATRLDAVGSTSEANALFKEGAGYPALVPLSVNYSFYRAVCGEQGSIPNGGSCGTAGRPDDNNDN
jgi:hypothetical protein